jgi:cytosine/uracil/thiamine/allantoin permease
MTIGRAVAILIGIAVTFVAEQFFGANWYVSFALGIIAYFVSRYALWAIAERARFKAEFDQTIRNHREK